MAYTVQQNPEGTATLLQDGVRVSTGTPSYIQSIADNKTPAPVTTFSSSLGEKTINDIKTAIEPQPQPEPKPTKTEPAKQSLADEVSSITGETPIKTAIEESDDRMNARISEANTFFDNYKNQLDTARKAQITTIQSQFEQIRIKQQEANRRREKLEETLQIRGGISRYSPEHAADNVMDMVNQGIGRIAEINQKEQDAIAQINSAFANNEMSLALKQFESVKELRDERDKEIAAIQKAQVDGLKKIQEEDKKLNNQGLIFDAVKTLKTSDVSKIFASLGGKVSTDEIKNFIEDTTPKESADISKNAFKFTSEDTGKMLGGLGWSGADVQTFQDTLNSNGLYNPSDALGGKSLSEILTPEELKFVKNEILYPPKKVAGISDNLSFTDLAQGTLVARLAFGTGRSLSDKDVEIGQQMYLAGKVQGLDVWQIADQVYGFNVSRNKPLAVGLRNTLLNINGQKGLSDYDLAGVANLINQGEDLKAIRKVEISAFSEARKLTGNEDFVSEDDILYVKNKVDEIEKLLGKGWNNEVGAFTGSMASFISRKFGIGQSASIQNKLNSLTANMINKRAGSALTETEWDRLISPSVPTVKEAAQTWKTKMQELIDNPLTRYNAIRSQVSLPSLQIDNITNPESRIPLYSDKSLEDTNPLELPDVGNNPLNLNL